MHLRLTGRDALIVKFWIADAHTDVFLVVCFVFVVIYDPFLWQRQKEIEKSTN